MKKIVKCLKKIDKNKYIIIVCILLMLSHIFTHGAIFGHDSLTHMFRTVGIAKDIMSGDLLAKIHYNSINGFGYGSGIFYPQLNLLFPALIYILIRNISISMKLYILFNTIISGLIMYVYLNKKVSCKKSALVGSLLYILAPYCYVQSMFRGAFGEMAIFVSLPLTFLGIEKILNKEKNGSIYLIIGSVYVLQSHLISSIYLAIFIFLYLIINYKRVISKDIIKELFKSLIIIILVSLYFIVPLIEHYKIGNYNMFNNTKNPADSIVYLPQLLYSTGQNAGQKYGYDIDHELPYTISLLLISLVICLPYCYKKIKKEKNEKEVFTFLLLGIITIFMMCTKFIWGHIVILDIIQYPWRLLAYTVFFLSVTCCYIFKSFDINDEYFNIVLPFIILLSFMQLNNYIVNTPTDTSLKFSLKDVTYNQVIDDEHTYLYKSLGGSYDYLPVECNVDYIKSRGNKLIAERGKIIDINNYKFKNGKISSYIEVDNNTTIELPFIYYLGYNIKLDNNIIKYHKSKNGFIEIDFDHKQKGILNVEYKGTVFDIIANWISIITLVLYVLYIIYKNNITCRS